MGDRKQQRASERERERVGARWNAARKAGKRTCILNDALSFTKALKRQISLNFIVIPLFPFIRLIFIAALHTETLCSVHCIALYRMLLWIFVLFCFCSFTPALSFSFSVSSVRFFASIFDYCVHFPALWSHFGYSKCRFQWHLFYLDCLCSFHSIPPCYCVCFSRRLLLLLYLCSFFWLPIAWHGWCGDSLNFRFFFTQFNGWWYEKHVLCLLANRNYCLRDSKYTIQLK